MNSKLLQKSKVLLIPLLITAVIGFLAFDLSDRYVKPVKLKSKNTASLLELLKKDINEANKIKGDLDSKTKELEIVNRKVPSSSSLPEVLEEISALADKSNLIWSSGTPAPSPVFDESIPQGLNAWSIGSTFTGDFGSIYNFVDLLPNIGRLVTIESLSLQKEQGLYTLNITMRFYAEVN
jgi:Tfp pilus assembly protein PilO